MALLKIENVSRKYVIFDSSQITGVGEEGGVCVIEIGARRYIEAREHYCEVVRGLANGKYLLEAKE